MLDQHEQIAIAGHDGRCLACEHDAHLARLRPPMLVHHARDLGFFHAAAPARLAARRKDPLPTLEPADVLPEGLAQKLAPASTFSTSHPVDLTCESRGKRDGYRPWRRHVAMLTQCLTSLWALRSRY